MVSPKYCANCMPYIYYKYVLYFRNEIVHPCFVHSCPFCNWSFAKKFSWDLPLYSTTIKRTTGDDSDYYSLLNDFHLSISLPCFLHFVSGLELYASAIEHRMKTESSRMTIDECTNTNCMFK